MKTITFTIVNIVDFSVRHDSHITIKSFIEKNQHMYYDSKDKKTYFFIEGKNIKNFNKTIADYAGGNYDENDIDKSENKYFNKNEYDTKNYHKDERNEISESENYYHGKSESDDEIYSDDEKYSNNDNDNITVRMNTSIIEDNDPNKYTCTKNRMLNDNTDSDAINDVVDDIIDNNNDVVDDINDDVVDNINDYEGPFDDFDGAIRFWELYGENDIDFVVTIEEIIIIEISDEQYYQPIIECLQSNDIVRACWTAPKKNSKMRSVSVNIKNSFSHYESTEYIGFTRHRLPCDGTNCDLITYLQISEYYLYHIKERYGYCNFKISIPGYKIGAKPKQLRIPILCNREIILKTFIDNIDECLPKNIIALHNYTDIRADELELYYASTDLFEIYEKSVRVPNNKNMLFEQYIDNSDCIEGLYSEDYTYIIAFKGLRKCELKNILKYLPNELINIIYNYVPPITKAPDMMNVVER